MAPNEIVSGQGGWQSSVRHVAFNKKKEYLCLSKISVGLLLSLATMAQANDHENSSTTDGAFITMMVQSDDPMSYISALKTNSGAFEATGTTQCRLLF